MKKKILMTGGSGFIASHFHERLTDTPVNNLDLVAPAHPLHSAHIQGDVRNPADVERAITGCSSIIHLAAAHHDFGISREEYFDVNENGARVICEAAAKHKVRDVVFYSSVAVFGEDYEMTVDDTEPRPTNDYGASKLAAERVLREWAREDTKRRLLIMRPVVVYGPRNYANMYNLLRQIASGEYFNIGAGGNIKSIAYVENLVEATLFLAARMKAGVETYSYSDEPHLSSREISDIIARALGRGRTITVPYRLAWLMALPFDALIALTGKNLPVSTNRVKKFCTQTYHDAPKVRASGFTKRFDNPAGLARMARWYLDTPSARERP